jgi:hypothetical protein
MLAIELNCNALNWQCRQSAVGNWQCNAGPPRTPDDVMYMMMHGVMPGGKWVRY